MSDQTEKAPKKDKEPEPKVLTGEPGASKHHFKVEVKFPVYSIDWLAHNHVLLAGGGGSSRTGVRNRLSLYKVTPAARQIELETEHELSKQEDAPMSIAIHPSSKSIVAGINSSLDKLKQGLNDNLRVFHYSDDTITFEKAKATLQSTSEDHYQKIAAFSRSIPPLLAIGSTNAQLSVLTYPALENVFEPIMYDEGDEIYDVDFNDEGNLVMGTSSKKLCIWDTKGEGKEPVQIIERPTLKATLTCTFRAAKFGRAATSTYLYTVVNSAPTARKGKGGDKKAFVSMWDTKTWKLVKTRTVSMKPVTSFDISLDGTLLAFGSSDLSVGVLDAKTLRSVTTVLHAHDFPVTCLRFNPTASLLISGSADNSIRVVSVPSPEERSKTAPGWLWNLLFFLLALVLAVYVQRNMDNGLLQTAREVVWH